MWDRIGAAVLPPSLLWVILVLISAPKGLSAMIISASRRTDIPAFYSCWFMKRIREGFCDVPNPFNPKQVSRISLRPEDVDVVVFWTRDPRPLIPHLAELDREGYRYYFLFTLMSNPRSIDPASPPAKTSIESFKRLAERVGPRRVVWRYDPILLSTATDVSFHKRSYSHIADSLRGSTFRSIISVAEFYRKLRNRLRALERMGVRAHAPDEEEMAELMPFIATAAKANGMQVFACAQERELSRYGILRSRCVDDVLIRDAFGIEVSHRKDPSQRKACGCVESRDIGMYDTCLFGCVYCYATSSFEKARMNNADHDPGGASLVSPKR